MSTLKETDSKINGLPLFCQCLCIERRLPEQNWTGFVETEVASE